MGVFRFWWGYIKVCTALRQVLQFEWQLCRKMKVIFVYNKIFFLFLIYFVSLPEVDFRIAFVHRLIVILIDIMWHYVAFDIYNKFSFHYIILLFQLSYRTCSGRLWKGKFAFYKMLHNLLPNNQCHQHSQTSYRVGSFSSHNSGFKYRLLLYIIYYIYYYILHQI